MLKKSTIKPASLSLIVSLALFTGQGVYAQTPDDPQADNTRDVTRALDDGVRDTDSVDGTVSITPANPIDSVDGTVAVEPGDPIDSVDGTVAARAVPVSATARVGGCRTGSVDGTVAVGAGTESVDGTVSADDCEPGEVIEVPASGTIAITPDGF